MTRFSNLLRHWLGQKRALLRASASTLGVALALALSAVPAVGQSIPIPNASFESPVTFFAYPDADEWEESGPVGEDPQLPGVEDTLDTGVFFNSPVGEGGEPSPYYIPNGDGNQIGFIFADHASTIAFYQELDTRYEVGGTYTVELLVGESFFFPPLTYNPNDPNPPPNPPPALLEVSLYHPDPNGVGTNGKKIVVAERIVSADEMPDAPNQGLLLVDISTTGAEVQPTDAWAGKPIGVMIRPNLGVSGVWNVDLARLSVTCTLGAPSDSDLDGDVDLVDHEALVSCLAGPGVTTPPAGCQPCARARLDADADDDVDLHDFAALTLNFGP